MTLLWRRSIKHCLSYEYIILKPIINRNLSDADPSFFPIFEPSYIRNFSIIAHVDHGKSTLADRLIEIGCGTKGVPQQLDNLQVERERGITVKAQTAALRYKHNGEEYLLNLIDTPGHVDFSHEVGRSLLVSDGAILLVDATQGVQAQTVSNFYTAFENDLAIIGAINKIDMVKANTESCEKQMLNLFDMEKDLISHVSAKTGQYVSNLLPKIIENVPPPNCDPTANFQALLHDCHYLPSNGIVMLTLLIKNGVLKQTDSICMLSSNAHIEVREMGVFLPHLHQTNTLSAGQMGYIIVRIKNIKDVIIGETIHKQGHIVEALKSLEQPKPTVFAGVFPDEQNDHNSLKEALEKLLKSDTSISMKPDKNQTLGCGWSLGFLGTLHMEVFTSRLEQEHDSKIILTSPSVTYRANLKNGSVVEFNNANEMPESIYVEYFEEPVVRCTIIAPNDDVAGVIKYCMNCRGVQKEIFMLDDKRFLLKYDLPLIECILDFFSDLKNLSSGYASCDFEDMGHWTTDISKVDVLINSKKIDGLSSIVRTADIRDTSLKTVQYLAKAIPQQLFVVVIQCVLGGKVTARSNIKPARKDVTKDLYGGDITRAQKLLKRQAAGKKKMKEMGTVRIPRNVFRMKT